MGGEDIMNAEAKMADVAPPPPPPSRFCHFGGTVVISFRIKRGIMKVVAAVGPYLIVIIDV